MACIPRPTLSKIPGFGMPLAKKESYAKDLTKLSVFELKEIMEREEKLLQNKSKLQNLPDKGKRIRIFYKKVLQEMERRSNIEEAANMFSNLNIVSKGEKTLSNLEWEGDLKKLHKDTGVSDDLDSDDEVEMDPLKIMARRQMHEIYIEVEKPELKLITEEDIKEIESFQNHSLDSGVSSEHGTGVESINFVDTEIVTIDIKEKLDIIKPNLQTFIKSTHSVHSSFKSNTDCSHTLNLEPHVYYLVDKIETQSKVPAKEKFKPFRTTVSNVHDPLKERQRKQGIHWEVTAATPPPIQRNGTELLSLIDSVEIQAQYMIKLKEMQEKQAADRLASKLKRLDDLRVKSLCEKELKLRSSFTKYRETVDGIEGVENFNFDDQVYDPVSEEKVGGINYTVYE